MFGLPTVLFYALVAVGFVIFIKIITVIFKNDSLSSFLIGMAIFVATIWLIGRGFLHIF